ncbi:cytidine deaminase [Thorsellia anophelis]|uniref:Cytidine deaminase n=1 Tax=Thorsellia anophelis DSM 18579 TaxID=1123402 RepID=A0A1I0BJU4_9GAMM|nr:cytidine deaminase [Thorsellia anophelis]SET06532.1 cytidine deaminase [Thorsellia anophelis DSM 18579]
MSNETIEFEVLIKEAINGMKRAYAPYSKFQVGAALLTDTGEIIRGCNIENASYGLTNCAERTALFKAVSEGKVTFKAMAIVGDTPEPIAPCGACRQVIREFCDKDMPIILANLKGDTHKTTISTLLPNSFGPNDLL